MMIGNARARCLPLFVCVLCASVSLCASAPVEPLPETQNLWLLICLFSSAPMTFPRPSPSFLHLTLTFHPLPPLPLPFSPQAPPCLHRTHAAASLCCSLRCARAALPIRRTAFDAPSPRCILGNVGSYPCRVREMPVGANMRKWSVQQTGQCPQFRFFDQPTTKS
jgi:hypothetical protein